MMMLPEQRVEEKKKLTFLMEVRQRYQEWMAENRDTMEDRKQRIATIKILIEAFAEKMIKNKKRFDSNLLYSMLKELSKRIKVNSLGDIQEFVDKTEKKLAAATPRPKQPSGRKSPTPSVYSAATMTSARESRRTSIVQRPEAILTSSDAVENLYSYFQWFLSYLQYLRDLKDNFDQRIFYPMFHLQQSEAATMDEESREENERLRETLYKSRTILSSLGEDFRELLEMCDDEEAGNAMNGLLYIGGRWESLLADKTAIDKDYFSLESEALVQNFRSKCSENLLCIIRLVPDIVVKGMKAETLVKKWCALNEKRNMNISERLARIKKIRSGLSKRSDDLLKKVKGQEGKLSKETADLDGMLKREDRWDILKVRFDEVEEKIHHLQADLRHMTEEKETLAKALVASARKDTNEFDNLKLEYEENQARFQRVEQQLSVQLYKRSIIESDLEVEMAVKPSLLRHTDHVQDRCEVIEKELELSKTERQALENLLAQLEEEEDRLQERATQRQPSISVTEASSEDT